MNNPTTSPTNHLISLAAKLVAFSLIALGVFGQLAFGQQTSQTPSLPQASPSPSPSQPADDKKAPSPAEESPMARLKSARTVLVTRSHGSDIPYDTIKVTMEGWMRFAMVDTPDKADLVVSVETFGDSEIQVGTAATPNDKTGHMDQSTKSTKDLSAAEVKMTVVDTKNKRVLWSATEKVKFAVKKTTKENNLVEAAERLASRFHDRLEPPPVR